MREILFRGKSVITGDWIYGVPVSNDYITCIVTLIDGLGELKEFQVKPETVGQYTGLTDKNGTKIFEGDIIKKTELTPSVKKVEFHDNEAAFIATWKGYGHELYDLLRAYTMPGRNDVEFLEVIGNVYDNSELLGGRWK